MPQSDQVIKPRVPTVHRVGQLLRAFTPAQPVRKLQDLSRSLGWDDTTTHRFLKALVDIGLLDYDEEDASYRIGLLPLELAAISLDSEPRRRELLQVMEEISDTSGLTVQVGVLEGSAAAIVASRESRGALNAAAMLGERLPLHATAAGKAILTQFSDNEIRNLLPRRLEAFTPRTIVDMDQLLAEVADARERGLAHAESELSEGLYALAIPIAWRTFGSHAAALTCAGLSRELVPDQWEAAEEALRAHASTFLAGPFVASAVRSPS